MSIIIFPLLNARPNTYIVIWKMNHPNYDLLVQNMIDDNGKGGDVNVWKDAFSSDSPASLLLYISHCSPTIWLLWPPWPLWLIYPVLLHIWCFKVSLLCSETMHAAPTSRNPLWELKERQKCSHRPADLHVRLSGWRAGGSTQQSSVSGSGTNKTHPCLRHSLTFWRRYTCRNLSRLDLCGQQQCIAYISTIFFALLSPTDLITLHIASSETITAAI